LIEHTVAVGTLVGETCQLHPRLNPDVLMAAALVHDIGKVREFTYGAEFGFTDEGRVLGHVQMGAEIVGAAAGALDSELKLALLGCVVSHHGIDQGRRFPSPEALALYRLNALDASIKDALEK
jgi:3'-5' exoribonuclease